MKISNVTRVDDAVYKVTLEGSNDRVELDLSSVPLGNRIKFAKKIFEGMSKKNYKAIVGDQPASIKINERQFVIKRDKNPLFLSRISNFFQKGVYHDVVKLTLSPAILPSISTERVKDQSIGISPKIAESVPLWHSDPKAIAIFEKKQLFEATVYEGRFKDPFTQLASHGMQNYQVDFAQKTSETSPHSVIITKSELSKPQSVYALVDAKDFQTDNFSSHTEVVSDYFQSIVMVWGIDKVELIQHRYGINLLEMSHQNQPLTIDVVYKMNIGLGSFEVQDVDSLIQDLHAVNQELLNKDPGQNLVAALQGSDHPMATFTVLCRGLDVEKNSHVTVQDAINWFNERPYLSASTASQLDRRQVAEVMDLGQLNPSEKMSMYTGRKLGGFVDSAYTIASLKEFKPWIDDQELSECKDSLLYNTSWQYFNEQLAFVVCKKHLVHTHPTLEYYVGALIPAPADKFGQEWYKVTSCINSGTGNLSYTLEPLASDSSLPIIKLFRSTASDSYALDSEASLKSDFNPLNSPGYEGQSLVEPFEKKLFLERTIPIWVGYQASAEEKLNSLNLDDPEKTLHSFHEIETDLKRSTEMLIKSEKEHLKTLDTRELFKQYDWIVLKCLQEAFRGPAGAESLPFIEAFNLFQLVQKYALKSDETPIAKAEQRSDAQIMMKILAKSGIAEAKILSDLLEKNVLQSSSQRVQASDSPIKEELRHLVLLRRSYQNMVKNHAAPDEKLALLSSWSKSILSIAVLKNESVSQKIDQKVICVGHSLGGSLAQRTFAKYTLLMDRMPVPGQKIELYDFSAPGINHTDNDRFMQTGNQHVGLFLKHHRPFIIHRSQVAGDFIPLAGTSHLGATFTSAQTATALNWLDFRAELHRPTKKATHAGITDTRYTHGVQIVRPSYETARIGEALSIPYDTAVQGDFNHRVTAITGQLWNIDRLIEGVYSLEMKHAFIRAAFRTDIFGRHASISETSHKLHGEWYEKNTPEGVFVVGENGLGTS